MKEFLISVIVPVYNVELYLRECVDSILSQTYRKLEIILVDDGSTDSSGNICDMYSQMDPRIRVIHKTNGGLSEARNAGLEIAKGEWILFVDSDDYILAGACATYIKYIGLTGADIVISKVVKFRENEKCRIEHEKDSVKVLTSEEALLSVYYRTLPTYAWGKIYRRKILGGIRFENNRLFEDEFWTPIVLENARTVAVIENVLYCYRQRKGSIVNSSFNAKKMDALDGVEFARKHFKNRSRALELAMLSKKFFQCSDLLGRIDVSAGFDREKQRLIDGIKETRKPVFLDSKNNTKIRIMALISMISPALLGAISRNRDRFAFLRIAQKI